MLNKKIVYFLFCLFSINIFSQTFNEQTQEESDLLDFLNPIEEAPDLIEDSLQRNFTIIQSEYHNNLNPHTATFSSEAMILNNMYEGLFSYDPATLNPLPAIAESYRISRNKCRWTFTLRDGLKFSNGEPITANEVRNSWISMLANPAAMYSSLFDIVSGAKEFREGTGSEEDVGIFAKDEKTLIIQLKAPASHLSRILCHHAFAIISPDEKATSGAYVLESFSDEKIVLQKNPNYWDENNVHLPKITILMSNDIDENTYLFNIGQADWIDNEVNIEKLLIKDAVQINAEFGTSYLFFKNKNEPWNNAGFRNALLTAVPWDKIRKNQLIKAQTLIYPLMGYPTVEGFSYTDSDEALELMREERKKANIPEDKVFPLKIAISDTSYMFEIAETLKEAWAPLGVEVLIEKTPSNRYFASIPDWNADLFSYSWVGDFADPLSFLELFRGLSTLNPSGYNNPNFNELIDQASADETQNHMNLLAQAEQVLLDDAMVLPIAFSVSLNAIDLNSVGGWKANALDIHPFKYLYFKQKTIKIPNLVKK